MVAEGGLDDATGRTDLETKRCILEGRYHHPATKGAEIPTPLARWTVGMLPRQRGKIRTCCELCGELLDLLARLLLGPSRGRSFRTSVHEQNVRRAYLFSHDPSLWVEARYSMQRPQSRKAQSRRSDAQARL